MKKGFLKRLWILVLIAVMVLPPLRMADAASSKYYTSIVVHKNPNKMSYDLGESFDKTGMEIYGNWYDPEDGSTGIYKLGLDSLTYSPTKFTTTGNITVTLTLQVKKKDGMGPLSCKLVVDVYDSNEGDPPSWWVTKITAEAEKTVYKVGESFDKSGLKVWAYSDGYVPDGYAKWNATSYVTKIEPTKFTKTGEQYVKVTARLTGEHDQQNFTAKIKVKVYDGITITKHPGGEIVEEGGACNFTVKADGAESYSWFFVKDSICIPVKDKDDYFPGLKYSGDHSKKLKLSNIPIELDGWSVMCEFSNALEAVESDTASIQVLKKGGTTEATVTATPKTETDPDPTDPPPAGPTAGPTEEPTATPEPVHEHSFDGVYHFDGKQHWLECSCGEKTAAANHIVADWTVLVSPSKDAPGIRTGYCVVCGAKVSESVPYEGIAGGNLQKYIIFGGIGLAGVAGVGCLIAGVAVAAKKKKAKAHKQHREEQADGEE